MSSLENSILPMRSLSSMSSRLCDSSEISPNPSIPARPLREWTSRKILLTSSGRTFCPCDSNSARSRERLSSSSSASPVNSRRVRSSSFVMTSRDFEQASKLFHELRRLERLHQILLGSQRGGAATVFLAAFGGDDHHRDGAVDRMILE